MKKNLLFCSFVLLLNTKSHSQTQFPFYGFELSNYEIGDTLEYDYSVMNIAVQCDKHEFFTFINKENLSGNDSIRYTLQLIWESYSQFCGPPWSGTSNLQLIISNDTVYNSQNNLLHVLLEKLNYDTTVIEQPFDSTYVFFDTLNGLKRLKSNYMSPSGYYNYNAIENIGIVNFSFGAEDIVIGSFGYNLTYAHLAHYGIYGNYYPVIYNNIEQPKNEKLISIFPNPADENLFIRKTQLSNSASVELYNYTGQLVFENKNFKEENINTKNLQNGFYVLKYADGNNYSVKKFLVQH